ISSRSSCSRKGGMSLSISLVTPWAAETVRGWRIPAISSTSSMNSTTLSSSATSANASRRAVARPAADSPASRDGYSSTNGQPSRDAAPLAKVVLPVPGRQHAPAELAEDPGAARVHGLQPLVEHHAPARGVPGVLQRQGADLAVVGEQALNPVR